MNSWRRLRGAWAMIPPVYRQMELVAQTPTDSLNIKKENSLFKWRKRLSSHVNRAKPQWHPWTPAVLCLTPSPPAHWRILSTKGLFHKRPISDICIVFLFAPLIFYLFFYFFISHRSAAWIIINSSVTICFNSLWFSFGSFHMSFNSSCRLLPKKKKQTRILIAWLSWTKVVGEWIE